MDVVMIIGAVCCIVGGSALVWNWWDERRLLREDAENDARFKKALEDLDDAHMTWEVRGSLIAVNALDEVISDWETADKDRVLALLRGDPWAAREVSGGSRVP